MPRSLSIQMHYLFFLNAHCHFSKLSDLTTFDGSLNLLVARYFTTLLSRGISSLPPPPFNPVPTCTCSYISQSQIVFLLSMLSYSRPNDTWLTFWIQMRRDFGPPTQTLIVIEWSMRLMNLITDECVCLGPVQLQASPFFSSTCNIRVFR